MAEGRITTESFYTNSEDRALHRGKHYCDKAPGASFTALPALALTRALLRMTGVAPESTRRLSVQMRVATWSVATLPALLLCWLTFAWAVCLGYWGLAFGLKRAYSLVPLWIGMGIGLVGLFRSLMVSPRGWPAQARRSRSSYT